MLPKFETLLCWFFIRCLLFLLTTRGAAFLTPGRFDLRCCPGKSEFCNSEKVLLNEDVDDADGVEWCDDDDSDLCEDCWLGLGCWSRVDSSRVGSWPLWVCSKLTSDGGPPDTFDGCDEVDGFRERVDVDIANEPRAPPFCGPCCSVFRYVMYGIQYSSFRLN